MQSDGSLVRRALSGRSDAFAELVRRWTPSVLAVCHALVRQPTAAEELAQETFVRAYVALGSLRSPERFAPWIRGIARRVCLDWIKSRRRPMVLFSQLGDDWTPDGEADRSDSANRGDPLDAIEQSEQIARLHEEIDRLPEELRTALLLYYYGDGTYAQLAELLEVSIATVNARLTRARALLRKRMRSTRR